MVLSIKNPEADRLAREVAARTGETITQAVVGALRERLAREEPRERNINRVLQDVAAIQRDFRTLPVRDTRPDHEILGYGHRGLPQ